MVSPLGFFVPIQKGWKAFVPSAPQKIAGIEHLIEDVEKCSAILSKLDTLITYLPNPYLLTENLIFMEAVTSSRIEGTKASYEDLFNDESHKESTDIVEVKNCANAFRLGEKFLQEATSVMDLAKKLHGELMKNDSAIEGGELKKSQNYTIKNDGSIFAYTPPHYLDSTLSMFEQFTMQDREIPELIRQAISHWIFEQIHPFPDGNGRVGRLLIPLILKHKGFTQNPFALISEFIEKEKRAYLFHFEQLHETGDWIPWCRFFLSALYLNADKNILRISNLENLRLDYIQRIKDKTIKSHLHQIVEKLFIKPRFTRKELTETYGLSPRGASLITQELIKRQIIKPVEGDSKMRNVVFEAYEILKVVVQ